MSGAVLIKTRFLLNVYAHSMKEYNMNNKLSVCVVTICRCLCVDNVTMCRCLCVDKVTMCGCLCVDQVTMCRCLC